MTTDSKPVLRRLLERHGTLFSQEIGLDLQRNTPSVLFRWLCTVLLMSARISHDKAISAAKALNDAGWTTAEHMAGSKWEDRVRVLNRAGYARFDESTARMLGDTAALLQDEFGGDLRKLRAAVDEDPDQERKQLKRFKGIGDVGADIFFRELQTIWPEHYPLLDKKSRAGAKRMGLPETTEGLAELVSREDFPHLVTALTRADLAGIDRKQLLDDD